MLTGGKSDSSKYRARRAIRVTLYSEANIVKERRKREKKRRESVVSFLLSSFGPLNPFQHAGVVTALRTDQSKRILIIYTRRNGAANET